MVTTRLRGDARAASTYDGPAKALHWLIVALLSIQFITALLLPHIKVDTVPDTVINLHFSFGIVILVVMAIRLLHRWMRPVAVAPRDAPALERLLARAMHVSFYVILLIAPFLGWAAASSHSVPVSLFGLVQLPAIAARGAKWGSLAGDVHGYAMWTLLGLVGLHACAALFHHFVRHDDVLRRMLPTVAD
jgi:cytochrome b561